MKAKSLLYAAMAAMVCLSCTREAEETSCIETGSKVELVAAWGEEENSASRTAIQEDGTSIWWTTGEEINAFFGAVAAGKFTSTNTEPAESATFSGMLNAFIGNIESVVQENACWAVYPYDAANTCDGESVTLTVSAEQIAAEGTFADKFFPAVARANTFSLSFWNVCGGARFSVVQEGVQKVIFKSNDGSPMSGKVRVGFGDDDKPKILEILDPVDSVVVNAPEGGFIPGTNYFAAMLPQMHAEGIAIILRTQDKKATRKLESPVTVNRSSFGLLDNVDEKLGYISIYDYAVPEMVDLGLSVKWASFNLGATKPEEFGEYFAWGETEMKDNYSWSTYKWCNGSYDTLTKYCSNSSYGDNGFTDNKTVLDPEDDAASVALGGSWRMATYAEWDELKTKCTWTWTTHNSTHGRLVTGPNGNSIFLPVCGKGYATILFTVGSIGYYWSSSLIKDAPDSAYLMYFVSGGMSWVNDFRCYGLSVRPVFGKRVYVQSVSLDKTTLTLLEGRSATLTATVAPSMAADKSVSWTSSDPTVATVSSEGVVNGVSAGTSIITVTTVDGGFAASCMLTVKAWPMTDLGKTFVPVDLGLPSGLKWASFNLGATTPEGYGNYYAWGETEPKSNYNWSTYKWCIGSMVQLTKYCNSSYFGYNDFIDNKTILDPEDDAATVALGGSWRMPTSSECQELLDNCTKTWTTVNGVYGIKFTSNNTGYMDKWIFLPAAGMRDKTDLRDVGTNGYYWSSSLWDRELAWFVKFLSSNVNMYGNERCIGRSVRPVYSE